MPGSMFTLVTSPRALRVAYERNDVAGDLSHNLGFVVIGPMGSDIAFGNISPDQYEDHVREHASLARWWFRPESDPRVRERPIHARDMGYALVEAEPNETAAPVTR